MGWLNYYGLIAVAILMIPNIIDAVCEKGAFENKYRNTIILLFEQIGRYGCMAFMIFNLPYTFGFWFGSALVVYLSGNGALLALYLWGWIVFRKDRGRAKMLWLSITPTALFLFSGITVLSIPLMLCSILFGIGHITISYKNIE